MTEETNSHHTYNSAIKMFTADAASRFEAADAASRFEDEYQLTQYWGGVWGIDNDVGEVRSVLVHRPGPEMNMVNPIMRIPEIAAFGDRDKHWYF